jgi:hypothetical protein
MSKDKKTRVMLSAWPHILALIQDGYLSNAESVVKAEEYQIDELRKKLATLETENDILKAIMNQQVEVIRNNQLGEFKWNTHLLPD